MRGAGTQIARGRVLAVGDAAGLVDPLSGDGMYEAFTSAHVASACVRDVLEGRAADLSAYPARLDAALGRHTSLAWIAKAAIERAPGVALRVARSRAIRRKFLQRTATSRDPLTRSAPHPAWRRAEAWPAACSGPRPAANEQPVAEVDLVAIEQIGVALGPRAVRDVALEPRHRRLDDVRGLDCQARHVRADTGVEIRQRPLPGRAQEAVGAVLRDRDGPDLGAAHRLGDGRERREARLVEHGDLGQVVAHEPVARGCRRDRT